MTLENSHSAAQFFDGPADMMHAAAHSFQKEINGTIQLVNHLLPKHLAEVNFVDVQKKETAWTKAGTILFDLAELTIVHKFFGCFSAAMRSQISELHCSDIKEFFPAHVNAREALSGPQISGMSTIKKFENFDPHSKPPQYFNFPQLMTSHSDGVLVPSFRNARLHADDFGDKGAFLRNHNATVQIISEAKNGVRYGGTGFFINANGFGVTNYHVIRNSNDYFRVKTSDGHTHIGRLLATDKGSDLAIFGLVKNKGEYHKFEHVIFKANPTISANTNIYSLGHPGVVPEQIYSRGSICSQVEMASALRTIAISNPGITYRLPKLSHFDVNDVRGATIANLDLFMPAIPGSSGSPIFESSGKLIGVLKDSNIHRGVRTVEGTTGATHAQHIMAMFDALPGKITGRYSMLSRVSIGSDGNLNVDIVKSKLIPLPPLDRHRKSISGDTPTLHWSPANQYLYEN